MLGDDAPGSSGGSGPGSVDPTQPLVMLVQRLQQATSATFDDPEQFIEGIIEELLELPPEQRFEDGAKVLKEHFVDEFGSLDAFDVQFPVASAILFTFLEQLLNQWAAKIARKALEVDPRHRNALLLVLAVVDVLQDVMEVIQAGIQSDGATGEDSLPPLELNEQEKYQLGSVAIASYARLYREIKRDQNGKRLSRDALATDALYGERGLIEVLHPNVEYPAIEERSSEERARLAIRRGALRVYQEADISVGRGAELARMTQEQFVNLLEQNDVRPNYGPDTVEELHSGPDLMNE